MIAMCVNCGWLGIDDDLTAMPIKSDMFQSIIKANNMHIKACPACKEIEICYKKEYMDNLYAACSPVINDSIKDAGELTEKIEKLVDEYPDPEEEYNSKLIDDILDSAERSRQPLDKQCCDVCGETFEAKFETSRCDACYDKLMERVAKDAEKEKKKAQKEAANKFAKAYSKKMKTKKKKKKKKL